MTAPPRLLVLTDRRQLPLGQSLRAVMEQCADAGLSHVVLRELDLDDGARAALAGHLSDCGLSVVAARRGLPGCVGVHLAAAQPVPDRAPGAWGRSCHAAREIGHAAGQGARWATLSPYSWTDSKPGHGPPLPADAYAGHRIPVYALGGVTAANAAGARQAGAHGVAVMGAVMRARDPAAVVAGLLREVAP